MHSHLFCSFPHSDTAASCAVKLVDFGNAFEASPDAVALYTQDYELQSLQYRAPEASVVGRLEKYFHSNSSISPSLDPARSANCAADGHVVAGLCCGRGDENYGDPGGFSNYQKNILVPPFHSSTWDIRSSARATPSTWSPTLSML